MGAFDGETTKFEALVSVLQQGVPESSLDSMNLDLREELVLKVIESPLFPGKDLIRFFKWAIEKPGFSVTTRLVDALVRAVCGELQKESAYALWNLVQEIGDNNNVVLNVGSLNHLIATFSKLSKGKAAKEVFDKFGEFGCVPDSDTFYYTIEALCGRHCFDWASSVCLEMLEAKALPDSEKIGKIVWSLSKGNKAKDAHRLYLLAKEENKNPPQSAVNVMISSLSWRNKTVELAVEMLDVIPEELKSATDAYTSVLKGLCRINDFKTAKVLLSKMINEGPPPGNDDFNAMINGYSKCGDMKEASEVLQLVRSRGLKPNLYAYTAVISGYVSSGQMEEACRVLSEAKTIHSKLTPVTYHTLIRGFCRLEQFDKALELLEEMKDFGVGHSLDEYNKLIQSLCLKGVDWEKAENLSEKMKGDGLQHSGMTKGLIREVKELEQEGLEKGVAA